MASPLEDGATLADLQTELYQRGYDHLAQDAAGVARGLRWINAAYFKVVLAEDWPFRLNTATGSAPLSILDMGKILTVTDTDNNDRELYEMTEAEITFADLGSTGSPVWFYRDNLQLKTWPVGGTLSVRYYSRPTVLASSADQTLIPERYADVIIDAAVIRAAKDRDDADAVALARQEYLDGLADMRSDLLVEPTHVQMLPWGHEDA